MSLRDKSISGVSVLLTGTMVQTVMRLAVVAVLARLLTPTEFGVVAAALLVIHTLDLEGGLGVAPALIQNKVVEARDILTGQVISIAFGLFMAACVFAAAPLIADLLGIERSKDALQVLSAIFLVRGFATVSEALLRREMRFHLVSIGRVLSYVLGYGAVGITLALNDAGAWALVFAELASVFILAGWCFWFRPIVFSARVSLVSARGLLKFGVMVSIGRILRQIVFNIDQFMIPRLFGAEALGLYSRASSTTFQPINALGNALESVLFPAFSKVQQDAVRLGTAYARATGIYLALVAPVVAFIAVFAEELILFFLGGQWLAVVLPMQCLAAGLFFRTATRLSATVLTARGRLSWLVWINFEHAAGMVAGVLLGMRYGLAGVAAGVSVAKFVHWSVVVGLVQHDLGQSFGRLLRAAGGAAPLALAPMAALLGAKALLQLADLHMLVELAVGGLVLGGASVGAMLLTPQRVLGDDGRWLLLSVSRMIPRRLSALRPLVRLLQRRAQVGLAVERKDAA